MHITLLFQIYETLLFFYGSQKGDFDGRWKSFHIVKSALEDKVGYYYFLVLTSLFKIM